MKKIWSILSFFPGVVMIFITIVDYVEVKNLHKRLEEKDKLIHTCAESLGTASDLVEELMQHEHMRDARNSL